MHYGVEAKAVRSIVKPIYIPVRFLKEKFTMVSLLQNMKSLISCQCICVPNHSQVQLFLEVINWWMDSNSNHGVIKHLRDLIILWGVYYVIFCSIFEISVPTFSGWDCLAWSRNVIDNENKVHS